MGSCCAHTNARLLGVCLRGTDALEENEQTLGEKPKKQERSQYTWQKTARISCHNFETNGQPIQLMVRNSSY